MQVNLNPNISNNSFKGLSAKRHIPLLRKTIHLNDINPNEIEGIQKGLKTFEGLNMKQIAFTLTDLHAINTFSGCKNHCLHCYANAQPFISGTKFEIFKQIADDLAELRNRLGFKPIGYNGTAYVSTFFDADSLNQAVYDKDGNKYDAVDLGNMIYNATGYKYIFDTNGWDSEDEEKQKIAESYVEKLLKDDNYKKCYQINISINPFNPKYVRAIKNGYNPNEYRVFKPCDADAWAKYEAMPEILKKAESDYEDFIKDCTNTLLTFSPLLLKGKLGVIQRVLGNDVTGMEGFRLSDFETTSRNIMNELYFKLMFDLEGDKKYVKTKREFNILTSRYAQLLRKYSTSLFSSGRLEKFYKSKTGSLDDIEKIDPKRGFMEECLIKLKTFNKISAAKLNYLKIIGSDGRVYMYDNYHMIPTDIKLNIEEEPPKRPLFSIPVQDFVLTTDMIDILR